MAPHRPHRADGKTECGPFSLPCDSVVRPAVCRAWWPAGGAPLSSLGGSLPVALCWLCEVGPRSDSVRAAAHATGQGAHTHQECTAHRSGGCRSETSANRGWVPGEALSPAADCSISLCPHAMEWGLGAVCGLFYFFIFLFFLFFFNFFYFF